KLKRGKGANPYSEIINWIGNGNGVSIIDDLSESQYSSILNSVPGLRHVIKQFHPTLIESQQLLLMEFLLHGLSETSQISKSHLDNGYGFKDMFDSLFNARFENDDEDDDFNDL